MHHDALIAADAGLSFAMPHTTYLEIDSAHVGDRFGIWVTLPSTYEQEDTSYPLVLQTDGNFMAPMTAPIHATLPVDPMNRISPTLQVSVGYPTNVQGRWLALRCRR